MKSRRTKACDISEKIRKIVYARDSYDDCPCCVFCGVSRNLELAHFIGRSQGGLGIPENLITACQSCHKKLDSGKEGYKDIAMIYLNHKHENWSEEKLYFSKED
jgi:5-methylcytosine-specific restriction endonuclease McrA